ncbi:jhy protein homolog [Antennarius striatus]|uniref:jhy protein homolog n=1 Tax=Antennarius striatus TaxID=241820 RepID=UPI0035AF0E81
MVTEESPVMFQTEYMDTHTSDREGSSSSEDVTYDPDWMTSPTGSVSSSPHRSIRTHDSVTSEQPFYLFPPDDVENSETSPQLNTFHQQEPTEAQEESTPMQRVSSTSLTDNISSTKKCSRPKLDAVEQNKITLGLNTTRRDSYMLLYGRQQDRPNDGGGVTPVSKGKSPNKNECQTQTDPEEEQPPESWGQPRSMDNVTTEIKCASSGKEEDPDEVLTGTASSASLLVSSTSSVLPPIVEPMGEELERNLDKRSTDHGSPSRCDGYLAHMEKQKQQGAKVTYKAYSLKDYKQLNSEIKLQGLGPDYKAIEGTVSTD